MGPMHTSVHHALALLLEFFTIAFSTLFPLMNPFGSAILFLGIVGPAESGVYRRLARRVAIRCGLFLIAVDLVGAVILTFFGISLPVIQVAGGLVLTSIGWRLLNQPDVDDRAVSKQLSSGEKELDEMSFYPFTFPLTAGPATVVGTLTLAAHAERSVSLHNIASQLGLFLAILVLCLMVYFAYAYAPAISRKISRQTIHGILRIIAFILLAIGIQIFWHGAEGLLHQAFPR